MPADLGGTEETATKAYLTMYVEETFPSTARRCGQIRYRSSDLVTDAGLQCGRDAARDDDSSCATTLAVGRLDSESERTSAR